MRSTTGMNKTATKYSCVWCRPVAGQSRFVAGKRTALDGLVWWCVYDQKKGDYVPGRRFKYRNECERFIEWCVKADRHSERLPFEPDEPDEQGGQN